MDLKQVLISQYLAALAMLEQAMAACPPERWDRPQDRNRFWQVVYHALFYTHLYLQPDEAAFVPWAQTRPEHHRLEQAGETYRQEELQEYLALCRAEVQAQVPALDLEAPSGFDWLPFNKLELQLYTIRHIQHHAGELYERLAAVEDIELHWVRMGAR